MTGGTAGSDEEFKVIAVPGSWGTTYPGSNCRIKYDATGANTVYFYPGAFVDGWEPGANRVGYADPGNIAWELVGDFNGWPPTGSPGYPLIALGDGVYSNSMTITTPGTNSFKFRLQSTWDISIGTDFGNGAANIPLITTNANQVVKFRLDLPNGRFLVGELPPPPVTNLVTFAVDMTAQSLIGHFDPSVDTVGVSGVFNGWPGTNSGVLVLTNYPAYNGGDNTNIYYAVGNVVGIPSTISPYKFVCNNAANAGANGYEPRGTDRTMTLLSTNGSFVLPVANFGDVYASDYLAADTTVIFTLSMTNAVTSTNSPSNINSPPGANTPHSFDPNSDSVIINGNFLNGGWIAKWDPPSLAGNVMDNNPVGSEVYQFSYTVPKGNPVEMHYKYGIVYAGNQCTNNSVCDDEAPSGQDHVRVIRITSTGTYNVPMDTFGDQHVEPSFGQLTAAPVSGGAVPLTWLGRPGVHLQSSTNLTGAWTDQFETDGTNWTAGVISTNGFVSQTNPPAAGSQMFFRLVKSW